MKIFLIFTILSLLETSLAFNIFTSIPNLDGHGFDKPQSCQNGEEICEKSDQSGLFPTFSSLVTFISKDEKSEKKIQQPDFCGQVRLRSTSSRIVGGKEANKGQFPWLAQIWLKKGLSDKFICGGSLISENVLVTAAHCIETTSVER